MLLDGPGIGEQAVDRDQTAMAGKSASRPKKVTPAATARMRSLLISS
jgi:hypothetical protein